MTFFEAIFLGVIQGLTEFLPISSSGHLVLFQNLLGLHETVLAFDLAVHWGTLFAVIVYFWRDLMQMVRHTFVFIVKRPKASERDAFFRQYPYALLFGLLVIATIPTVLIGYAFQDAFEYFFRSVPAVGFAWLIMGVLLILSERFQRGDRPLSLINSRDAFFIGIAQGASIFPGISRSGLTIVTGMICGIERKEAARFSFLIALPAIIAAGVFKFSEEREIMFGHAPTILTGFLVAAIVGYFAIVVLLKITERGKFFMFGYYCIMMALFSLAYAFAPILK